MGFLRRKPKFTVFGQLLVDLHERWDAHFAATEAIEHPNRVVLASASAGATVALGEYGTGMVERFADTPTSVPGADREVPDRIAQFARALDDAHAVEAAYRVVTWALVAEFAVFFWRPNYDYELAECTKVFEIRNDYEATVLYYGRPLDEDATADDKGQRLHDVAQASLYGSVSAALDVPIAPGDDPFMGVHMPAWIDQFMEGKRVGGERLTQLAPDGLPIWE